MDNRFFSLLFRFFFPVSSDVWKLEEISFGEFMSLLTPADKTEGGVYALWKYSDPHTKTAVWEIKYGKNTRIASKVGEILYAHIESSLEDARIFGSSKKILLIPIPSSKSKKSKKGYNQTEFICGYIKKHDKENFLEYRNNLLIRTKETLPQTKIKTKKNREKNPRDSFGVTVPKDVRGKSVVLIDDVVTTGSTLREAARILKEAGAQEIKPFVIAH